MHREFRKKSRIVLIDDNYAIESCINSTENFEDNLYNTFEENTQKI